MLFYEVEAEALLALPRTMNEYHEHHNPDAPFSEGTLLTLELAAEHVGLDPDSPRYERAVGYLVREGALVWEENGLARCRRWTSTGLPSGGWSC